MRKRYIIIFISFVLGLNFIVSVCYGQSPEVSILKAQLDSVTNQLTMLKLQHQQLEANKKLVADLYQELFGDKNIEAADKYIVENYIQHNPHAADGREALKEVLKVWFKNAPKENIDIQHIGADGNFVYIHTKMKMGNKINSVMDIFRIEDNKVVEHWDVIQEVPEKSVNPHPMF
jgi:predicted SnoaL-like aldol condensation-catalyzing enzyme